MTIQAIGVTVGASNVVAALSVRVRPYLAILNQSTTATVYVAFDTAAVAAPTAGQITLLPVTGPNMSGIFFNGQDCPNGAVNLIATAAGTPVTVIG